MADPLNTLLVLEGVGVPPFSARGLTQTLEAIDAIKGSTSGSSTVLRRSVNGALIDLTYSQFRKFKSEIVGDDQDPPAVDGLWTGKIIAVQCIPELCFLTATAGPERPVVPGSERTDGDFTFYRPILIMRVIDWQITQDEWGAALKWKLDLEEN